MGLNLERMPKEPCRYGFVLRNQTNLNRPPHRGISGKPEKCSRAKKNALFEPGIDTEWGDLRGMLRAGWA